MKFDDIINRLSKIPRSQRMAIYAVVGLVLVVVYVFVMFLPKQEEIAKLTSDRRSKQQDLALVEKQVKSLDGLKQESARLKAALMQAKRSLPENSEIPKLIKTISEKGRKVGLEIRKFQPGAQSDSPTNEFVAQVPIALAVEGSFHQVAMFFDRIAKMDRIVHVKNIDIEIAEETASNVSLLVEGSVITFRFLTDEERAAKAKKKKKKKRKRRR